MSLSNMGLLHIIFLVLPFFNLVESSTPQTEFLDKTKFSELIIAVDSQLRNILTEFHEIKEGDINFFLLTRENPNPSQLNDSNLNLVQPQRLTNLIVGGWLQNFRTDPMYLNIAKEYLQKGDYNIIIVDDHKLKFLPGQVALSYIEPIGIIVGKFITKLHEQIKVSLRDVTIIGHSLGGNLVGFAGREVKKLTGKKIGRIIGIDSSHFPYDPLNKNDAKIVELIHTTATAGLSQSLGTVDFYPNGGSYDLQPGCTDYPTNTLNNISDAIDYVFCSHHKSYQYFILTINKTVKGVKCKSYDAFQNGKCKHNELAIFGDNYVPGPKGSFYLYLNCTDTDCVSSYY